MRAVDTRSPRVRGLKEEEGDGHFLDALVTWASLADESQALGDGKGSLAKGARLVLLQDAVGARQAERVGAREEQVVGSVAANEALLPRLVHGSRPGCVDRAVCVENVGLPPRLPAA